MLNDLLSRWLILEGKKTGSDTFIYTDCVQTPLKIMKKRNKVCKGRGLHFGSHSKTYIYMHPLLSTNRNLTTAGEAMTET